MSRPFKLFLLAAVGLSPLGCKFPSKSQPNSRVEAGQNDQARLSFVGSFDAQSPAFLALEPLSPNTEPTLLISSFGKDVEDTIYALPSFSKALGNIASRIPVSPLNKITNAVTWPNGAKMAPEGMFSRPTLVVAGGFLPPGKVGAITLITSPGTPSASEKKITTNKFSGPYGWFYHKVEFRDFDGDGDLDILTARALFPLVPIPFLASGPRGEMLWLENPSSDSSATWKEHIIADGPDVHFELVDLNNDGTEEIIAPEFWGKKVSVWWKDGQKWNGKTVIEGLNEMFDARVTDVNHDGKLDLLFTNHVNNGHGGIFAAEIPVNFRQENWKVHTLLGDIPTTHPGTGQAAPGTAFAVAPTSSWNRKPLILASGDGAERVYLLTPASEDPSSWDYKTSEPLKEVVGPSASAESLKSVIGQILVGDFDQNGRTDILVPAYSASKIFAFTF
jgi:hypothetical protein